MIINKFTKQGFTLIELLVVVLIIGILSAVALPQYQMAVEKSRLAEPLQLMASLQQAIDVYVLEHGYQEMELVGDGSETGVAGVLDVDIESGLDCKNSDQCDSKYFSYDAYCETDVCHIRAYRDRTGAHDWEYMLEMNKDKDTGAWTRSCWTEGTDLGQKICKSLQSQGMTYHEGNT